MGRYTAPHVACRSAARAGPVVWCMLRLSGGVHALSLRQFFVARGVVARQRVFVVHPPPGGEGAAGPGIAPAWSRPMRPAHGTAYAHGSLQKGGLASWSLHAATLQRPRSCLAPKAATLARPHAAMPPRPHAARHPCCDAPVLRRAHAVPHSCRHAGPRLCCDAAMLPCPRAAPRRDGHAARHARPLPRRGRLV